MNVDLIINKVTIENLSKSETIQQITDAGDLLPLFKGEDKQKLETFKQRLEDHLATVTEKDSAVTGAEQAKQQVIDKITNQFDAYKSMMIDFLKQAGRNGTLAVGSELETIKSAFDSLAKDWKVARNYYNEKVGRLVGNIE